jgi:hypothetical protein
MDTIHNRISPFQPVIGQFRYFNFDIHAYFMLTVNTKQQQFTKGEVNGLYIRISRTL